MALRIPDRYKDGLAALTSLSDENFSELYGALKAAPRDVLTAKDLVESVSMSAVKISTSNVKQILDVLTSLRQTRSRTNATVAKIASDVSSALETEDAGVLPKERLEQFRSRLEKLLQLETLDVLASKAKELQSDVERAFCEARILTDLRPIFGAEVSTPKAMIIVHTLKLAYHDGATGRLEEIFVSLDEEDIRKLKLIAERAEQKTKSLLNRLETAGIKTVDLSQETQR